MNTSSTNGKTSPSQRAEVLRLAAEAVSVRQIAARVFGDERFRGRVERILKRDRGAAEPVPAAEPLAIEGLSELEVFKLLFQRRLAAIAAAGGVPSMNELRNLLDVQRQLAAWEQVERVQEATRRRYAGDPD